jgi:2,5-diamino-6-(ribosylamino)-4(3H)-pyrimidinone 5'-phosphate reductase
MRPFVFINMAMSADGKISNVDGKQIKISGKEDFERVDELKLSSDAIMVGVGTILSDDPSLTIKSEERRKKRISDGKDENPVRIVIDSGCRTPLNAEIFKRGDGKRIVATSDRADEERIREIERYADVIVAGEDKVNLKELMDILWKRGINKVMVEGGGELSWGLISSNIVDELYIYVGPKIIGGRNSPTPVGGEGFKDKFPRLKLINIEEMDDGVLLRWRFTESM